MFITNRTTADYIKYRKPRKVEKTHKANPTKAYAKDYSRKGTFIDERV